MIAYVYLVISIVVFGLLSTYWKSKNFIVLLFLFAGSVISASIAGNLSVLASDYVSTESLPLGNIVRALLLILPPVLAMLITRGRSKKNMLLPNLIIGIVCSFLAYLWFLRTLPYDQFTVIEANNITTLMLRFRDIVAVSGVILSLGMVLVESSSHKKSKKSHKSKD